MALRYGGGTRFTQGLDATRVQPLARFRSDFEELLSAGWPGFTGRLIERPAPRPPAVPTPYVMQPFEVKLDYMGRPWCTVRFELRHNEIGDADEPDYHLAFDLADLFTDVGLEAPKPVPVMRADHQVAQKLHAVSSKMNERARPHRPPTPRQGRGSRSRTSGHDVRPTLRLPAAAGMAADHRRG